MSRWTLLVCLKYPAAGTVKTRLAESLGERRAAELYRQWIGLVFEQLQPLRGRVHVVGYFTSGTAGEFSDWHHLADEWWPQPHGDLGGRLAAGFERAHARGGLVAAIGTDCLEIDADLVYDAFSRLDQHDVVFGPATDGGYYLVGTSRRIRGFFDGVPWSCAATLSTHVSLCEQQGRSVSLLPPRRDIDTAADWQAHLQTHNQTQTHIHTRLSVAVVIPTLNEEAVLADALESVKAQMDERVSVIVADGGSTDSTVAIARKLGVEVIQTPRRGRGCQISAAVETVSDDVVLVLHADTRLPPEAIARIRAHMQSHSECPGGCLGHRFDSLRSGYRFVERVDARRARRGMSYGDQGQFFRPALLLQRGGFPDQPIMEDVELSRHMLALGPHAYLDCPVLASPRRLEGLGLWQSAATNFFLRTAYRLGGVAACDRLYRLYYRQTEHYRRAERPNSSLAITTEISP